MQVGRHSTLNEIEHSSVVPNRRKWTIILIMLVLFFLGPFIIEIRLSTYFSPVASISDFMVYSWTWVYSFVGHNTNGFIPYPFYLIFQQGSLQTFFEFIFFAAFVGVQLEGTSVKNALRIGYVSLFPGFLVLTVNIVLGILVPFGGTIIAPIPTPLVSIIGILLLKRQKEEQETESWLTIEE